ncbi:MAG: transglycosylase domain-containing protein [Brevinematales bacterium]|nr:transglycosylase domain-containing protein [Brevinematales bacterium]
MSTRSLFSRFLPIQKKRVLFLWRWVCLFFLGGLTIYFLFPYPSDSLISFSQKSIKIYDRNELLLMEITRDKGGFCSFLPLHKVPSNFLALLVFSEDKRFFEHRGWSPIALTRAMIQNLRAGRLVSGGSTITQQLVRLRRGKMRNNLWSKITEIFEAYRLELHFTKEEILEAYINSVFLGNNIYGFEKAANIYFGKSLEKLNELEMAALIRVIPAPTRYQPYRSGILFTKRAQDLLHRAIQARILDIPESLKNLYSHTMLAVLPMESRMYAPLFCLYALKQSQDYAPLEAITALYTTFDLSLYTNLLPIVSDVMKSLSQYNAKHAAVVIIDNPSSELRVMIGSLDFFDEEKGQINASLIRKQVGSVMKPFAYALALEKRLFHASSILPDIYTEFPSSIGRYIPKNFTRTYHGPVRFAVALASSYNVSAVFLTAQVGMESLYRFLKKIGFTSLVRSPSFYGLGLVLGNADMTLLELAQGYTIFAKGGVYTPVRTLSSIVLKNGRRLSVTQGTPQQVMSPETAFLISHILSDPTYKLPAFGTASPIYFPFPVAVKTGTTKDFRDNCVVGYTPLFTTAVWVGNLYNEPMKELASVGGAGKILRNIELFLWNRGYAFPSFKTDGLAIVTQRVCSLSGMIAHEGCTHTLEELYTPDNLPSHACTWHDSLGTPRIPAEYQSWAKKQGLTTLPTSHLTILFPSEGAVFAVDPQIARESQAIPLEATGETNILWVCDGVEIGRGNRIFWPLHPGKHTIEAISSHQKRRVTILVVEE